MGAKAGAGTRGDMRQIRARVSPAWWTGAEQKCPLLLDFFPPVCAHGSGACGEREQVRVSLKEQDSQLGILSAMLASEFPRWNRGAVTGGDSVTRVLLSPLRRCSLYE